MRGKDTENFVPENANEVTLTKLTGQATLPEGHVGAAQALLPKEYLRETLADLKVGEARWIVSWAVVVDEQLRCWLSPDTTTSKGPGGTLDTLVIRTPSGYNVRVQRVHKWSISNISTPHIPITSLMLPPLET